MKFGAFKYSGGKYGAGAFLQKLLSEAILLSDSIFTNIIVILLKNIHEVISVLDNKKTTSNFIRSVLETVSLVDSQMKSIFRLFIDSIFVSDSFIYKYIAKIFQEIIGVSDNITSYINGLLIGLWSKVAKTSTDTWSRVSKTSTDVWHRISKK